jgi:hypothetical protein
MLLSRHQNAGQNHNIKIDDRSFENVAQLKYLGVRKYKKYNELLFKKFRISIKRIVN